MFIIEKILCQGTTVKYHRFTYENEYDLTIFSLYDLGTKKHTSVDFKDLITKQVLGVVKYTFYVDIYCISENEFNLLSCLEFKRIKTEISDFEQSLFNCEFNECLGLLNNVFCPNIANAILTGYKYTTITDSEITVRVRKSCLDFVIHYKILDIAKFNKIRLLGG